MALYGSLPLSLSFGLCRNQCCYKTEKSSMSRTRLHQPNASPSLLAPPLRQHDSWNIIISDYLHRRRLSVLHRSSVPHRTISFRCHSITAANNPIDPTVKATTLVLTKTYNVIKNYPIVHKLVPAVALLIFSLWSVMPFIRQGRNILFNKSDNNWRKSSTYNVITSYIQPLLLWIGALFVCRSLDHVVLTTEASRVVKDRLLNFVRSFSTVLTFAHCLSSLIRQTQRLFTETNDPNDARNMGFQFVGKAIYSAVWVAAISLFMELLGFSTQKWLTAGGLGTVLITLSGREIFRNFISSVMIHATRPFVVNERIQMKIKGYEVSGKVEHVGWWSRTIIRGDNREAIHIPNHKFTVNVIRNLTQKTHWRIKTHLAISHLDVDKINNIVADMRKVLAKNPQVEQQRLHRRVFLDYVNQENQALVILISCFVKTSHREEYLCVKEAILLDLLRVISHHRARLATPIRTIRKMYTDSDLENPPFEDSLYDQDGVESKRPLLRIKDKSKSHKQPSKSTGDQENKSSSSKTKETQLLDPKVNRKVVGEKPSTKSILKPNPVRDLQKSGSGKSKVKSETERGDGLPSVSRSVLEDNIVLEVALEGSKRTLPIEEMHSPSAMAALDAKELAASRRNRNGQAQANNGAPDE